jgi:hypothetical protein
MFLLKDILEVKEIKCFEINNDDGGPPIKEMIPYFKMVQKAGRPLLIRGSFTIDDIKLLMKSLEPRGLFIYIIVKSIEDIYNLKPLLIPHHNIN